MPMIATVIIVSTSSSPASELRSRRASVRRERPTTRRQLALVLVTNSSSGCARPRRPCAAVRRVWSRPTRMPSPSTRRIDGRTVIVAVNAGSSDAVLRFGSRAGRARRRARGPHRDGLGNGRASTGRDARPCVSALAPPGSSAGRGTDAALYWAPRVRPADRTLGRPRRAAGPSPGPRGQDHPRPRRSRPDRRSGCPGAGRDDRLDRRTPGRLRRQGHTDHAGGPGRRRAGRPDGRRPRRHPGRRLVGVPRSRPPASWPRPVACCDRAGGCW